LLDDVDMIDEVADDEGLFDRNANDGTEKSSKILSYHETVDIAMRVKA
jgi:hypothetical protein